MVTTIHIHLFMCTIILQDQHLSSWIEALQALAYPRSQISEDHGKGKGESPTLVPIVHNETSSVDEETHCESNISVGNTSLNINIENSTSPLNVSSSILTENEERIPVPDYLTEFDLDISLLLGPPEDSLSLEGDLFTTPLPTSEFDTSSSGLSSPKYVHQCKTPPVVSPIQRTLPFIEQDSDMLEPNISFGSPSYSTTLSSLPRFSIPFQGKVTTPVALTKDEAATRLSFHSTEDSIASTTQLHSDHSSLNLPSLSGSTDSTHSFLSESDKSLGFKDLSDVSNSYGMLTDGFKSSDKTVASFDYSVPATIAQGTIDMHALLEQDETSSTSVPFTPFSTKVAKTPRSVLKKRSAYALDSERSNQDIQRTPSSAKKKVKISLNMNQFLSFEENLTTIDNLSDSIGSPPQENTILISNTPRRINTFLPNMSPRFGSQSATKILRHQTSDSVKDQDTYPVDMSKDQDKTLEEQTSESTITNNYSLDDSSIDQDLVLPDNVADESLDELPNPIKRLNFRNSFENI